MKPLSSERECFRACVGAGWTELLLLRWGMDGVIVVAGKRGKATCRGMQESETCEDSSRSEAAERTVMSSNEGERTTCDV